MKNLFKKSAIAFVMLSFFVISCEKVIEPKVVLPIYTRISWNGGGNIIYNGNVLDGELGEYNVKSFNSKCNCTGKWGIKITKRPVGETGGSVDIDPKTGEGSFVTGGPGTYELTITYTCDNGTVYSLIVTITVK